jgi:hypothetical protein
MIAIITVTITMITIVFSYYDKNNVAMIIMIIKMGYGMNVEYVLLLQFKSGTNMDQSTGAVTANFLPKRRNWWNNP